MKTVKWTRFTRTAASLASSCPYCGTPTGVACGDGLRLGELQPSEFERMVISEWIRRLGAFSQHRRQPRSLIRGLASFLIPGRSLAGTPELESFVRHKVSELRAEGLSSAAIKHEFGELVMAIRAVLKASHVEWEQALRLTGPIQEEANEVLANGGDPTPP